MDSRVFRDSMRSYTDLIAIKWLGQPDVPRVQAFQFMNDFASILRQTPVTLLLEIVLNRLSQLGENAENLQAFQQMFHDLQNPFVHIDTEHKCLTHLEKDLEVYFPPEEVTVDPKDFNERQTISNESTENVRFQFIPLRKCLKVFFEIPGVLDSTLTYLADLENDSSVLLNFTQTENWKSKKQVFGNRLVLPLYLYWDEYETNNPLGSHRGIGKVGAVYAVIACLHPQLQSKVENIFILTLFRSVDLDLIPLHMLFSKAVSELLFLENKGITVSTPDGPQQIYFSVGAFIGDNLAVHCILGFTMGFIANYPCRFCHVKSSDMNMVVKESHCQLRDEQSYKRDLLADNPTATGVVKQSAISDLKSSSTLELMCVDPAHDILEGVLEYDIGFVMFQFIEIDKFITLKELNSRIQNFEYGPNESNKPRPIKPNQIKNKHIKMSASEALCFLRNLGLLIGDLIPRANVHWKLVVLLKEIIDIVFSSVVSYEILDHLESIIAEYLLKLNILCEGRMKPKHHLLIHYASVSRRFGPLWNLATLRCESKNRISKMAAHASRNRQNITKTIAIKCQLQLADRILRKESVKLKLYEYQTSEILPFINLPNVDSYFYLFCDMELPNDVKKFDSIVVKGQNICKNAVLMIPGLDDPELYVVHVMFEIAPQQIFTVVRNVTEYNMYDCHFQGYELYNRALTDSVNWSYLTTEQLRTSYVSYLTKSNNGNLYIPKRWI